MTNADIEQKTFEKPMVIRKLNLLLDLIEKEDKWRGITIILNHLLKNVNVSEIVINIKKY